MLTITTNIQSLISQRSLSKSTQLLNQAIERMSTGYKLNHASDNAANYSISTNLTTKLGAYQVAEDNAAQGLDMLTTANDSLNLISDHLVRIRALAEQAANGTYGAQSLDAINSEVNARVDEIERLYNTTEYNGIDLMKGKLLNTEESNFIKDIDRRDTSRMEKLSDVDETKKITSGTYSISTAEELAKLAEMTNNGLVRGGEFVLANDIDLSSYSNWTPIGHESSDKKSRFKANFDGNGYTISNLTINRPDATNQGLFGSVDGNIYNLGLTNVNMVFAKYSGALVGNFFGNLENCFVTVDVISTYYSGGIIGDAHSEVVIDSCYTDCNVQGGSGFLGAMGSETTINNCMVLGEADRCIFADYLFASPCIIKNSFYNSSNTAPLTRNYPNITLIVDNVQSIAPSLIQFEGKIQTYDSNISLQVGINSTSSSQIELNLFDVNLKKLQDLRNIGITSSDYFTTIDSILSIISEKQTEYGAAQNRLESALDEISTQYENLLSSRSTLKDADIAKVSSQYIQQQILQQASATLMSTANQTPALALQLL